MLVHIITVDAIRCEDLSRSYDDFEAVKAIKMNVTEGSLHGLVGPNGAGKTTIIKMICGIIPPTSGNAWVSGYDISTETQKVKASIGYLAEQSYLYEDMEVAEYLAFFASIYGMGKEQGLKSAQAITKDLGISDRMESQIGTLSKGLQRRVAISRALLHDPSVLIFDEVTSGLDPVSSQQIRKYLKDLPQKGKTVLLSTHDLYEADVMCDEATILAAGNVLDAGRIEELSKRHPTEDDGRPLFERIFFSVLEGAL